MNDDSEGGKLFFEFLNRPESHFVIGAYKSSDSMPDVTRYNMLIEKERKIAKKRGDTPWMRFTLTQFLGGELNDCGVFFTKPENYSLDNWPEGIDKNLFDYSPKELYAEAKQLEKAYNSSNPEKKITISALYSDRPCAQEFMKMVQNKTHCEGPYMIGYCIEGLEDKPIFVPFERPNLIKANDIYFEDLSKPAGLTQEQVREWGNLDMFGRSSRNDKISTNIENILSPEGRLPLNQRPVKLKVYYSPFEGKEFKDDSIGKRLGVTLEDMGLSSGPGSKKEVFSNWWQNSGILEEMSMTRKPAKITR
jgi:hypothetical protein